MIKNNFHTHTVYCDGKSTPEEFVSEAIKNGSNELGFSGHSFTDIEDDDPFCMTKESTEEYKAEITRLKAEYKDKIKIYMGVEQDYYSTEKTDCYDYVIGSVHYVLKDGYYIPVDETKQLQIDCVNKYYNGDFYAFCEDYYELVGDLYNKTKCDIVGHFDIITKYNEGNCLFDTNNPRYVAAANKALEKLMNNNLTFEINYGAVISKTRTSPYPEQRIIDVLRENNEKIICSSDCHKKEDLLFGITKTAYFNDFKK